MEVKKMHRLSRFIRGLRKEKNLPYAVLSTREKKSERQGTFLEKNIH